MVFGHPFFSINLFQMLFRARASNIFQHINDGVVFHGLSMGLRVGVQFILSSLFRVSY